MSDPVVYGPGDGKPGSQYVIQENEDGTWFIVSGPSE